MGKNRKAWEKISENEKMKKNGRNMLKQLK